MPTTDHYDPAYFDSHYRHLLRDDHQQRLLAAYWREALFVRHGLDPNQTVLDYGCGLGAVSGALPNATLYDVSAFVLDRLEQQGRRVVRSPDALPRGAFDAILSSHSLEHVLEPAMLLRSFRELVHVGGRLVLVLPIERRVSPALSVDHDRHLYCWTSQTITNLLHECGWQTERQSVLYAPFMLRTLGARLPERTAVQLALRLGRLRRNYPSLLTVALAGG